jgi:hypothetical protein
MRLKPKGFIESSTLGAIMNGRRGGFINIHDMYNNDVGKGVVYAYEAYEAK